MTEWHIRGDSAKARCQGFDIEVRWGTGGDYLAAVAESPSKPRRITRPKEDAEGLIIRVRSPHQKVDIVQMLQMHGTTPENAVASFTRGCTPQSLLPQHEDWMDEWTWLVDYRDKCRWRRRNNQALAFVGHLTLTVKMTTMKEAIKRITEGADPDRVYGSNIDLDNPPEGYEDNTTVFITELREDLSLIASMIGKPSEEYATTIKEYCKRKDPACVVVECVATAYENTAKHTGFRE